ncbi:cytochrome P450 1A1 [Armadillidium vulgare]|nr:cytochrome P450 1A1 [Armadillidium vulgare]
MIHEITLTTILLKWKSKRMTLPQRCHDLMSCVSDLFVAGMESTTPTIYFAIFYLASFPEVQRKIRKELDEVLPNGTLFTLADKPRLPYTEAFITEVLRYSSLGSLGVFRTVQRDTSFGGYTIPKGAICCVVGIFNPFR